ncbi:MAG: M48 family metallopeptidase [Nitrospirales bacterium]|nr:M48 family metallopeptidase [Nitrospirales bacterium]
MSFTPNALYFGRAHPATGLPCRLDVLPTELKILLSESVGETIPLDRLAVKSGGFDQDHLILSWTVDGEERQVYVKDPAVIHVLKTSAHPDVSRHTHQSMKGAARACQATTVRIWVAAALIIAVLAGLWVASDVLVRMAVNRIPIEWERILGESARQEMLTGQRVVTEGPAVKAVEEMTRRLTDHVPGNPYRFDVTVVRNDAVNAMALPGGSVIVYTGLLKQAESPEEVAGVLAHEVNHVLLRHGVESMVQSVGVMALVMVLLGNQQGLIGALERLGIQLTTMKFSREKETEADVHGLHLLHQANISPAGMIRFFERLARSEGAPVALLSTHPMSAERAARLKKEEQALPSYTPGTFAFDWQSIKDGL